MSVEVTEAAAPAQWADYFDRALDDAEAAKSLTASLRMHLNQTPNIEVQDGCIAGLDLMRRWREAAEATQVGEPFRADILLNDYRPIRPYARSIGQFIGEQLQREVSRG